MPSPPRLLARPSTISPFRFGTPRSSTVNFRKDEEGSTLAGEPSPTRHSRLQKVTKMGETPAAVPKQLENSVTAFPILSVTAPTSEITTVAPGSIHTTTKRVSNLALSPPLSSHTRPPSRPTSGISQAPSVVPTPFSQPQTPIPISAPPLTITHFECYQSHAKLFKLSNRHYTVPCMICKVESREDHWKCTWCYLWICATCVENLRKIDGRSLSALVDKVVKKKENDWKAMGGKEELAKTVDAKEGM